ncbi:MAG: proline racemase [Chloroflexota bacterium]|nr:proline racemase [Chloroflexota bacterium]
MTEITTTDYHTGGEPFRIVTGAAPPLEGRTVPDRRRWAAANIDHVRQLLVNEPRGHADMYGGFVTPPDDAGADLGVVFFHNEGYSTACGHGTIALVTWAIDSGRVAVEPGARQVRVTVDVPSGRLECTARMDDRGRVESVAFRNVPSFVLARDVAVATARGTLELDVAFGGAFYGSLDVRELGLRVEPGALPELIALQRELRPALERALDVVHPEQPDLSGIYGVIFWEPVDGEPRTQRNVTVFADGEVDRSPCGSGTSARLAILHARGEIGVGETLRHRSIVDSVFEARVVAAGPPVGPHASLITEVEGSAFLTGQHAFTLDARDPLGTGFLLR